MRARFLNSHFERYILADINPDLINLFNIVKENVDAYIEACKPIFFAENANTADYYYTQRDAFNQSSDPFERSVLFLYLNRFGFNGLCRYNSKMSLMCPLALIKPIISLKMNCAISPIKHKARSFYAMIFNRPLN